ncbi:MAG: NnrS family protein [Betaproteobacteria bacterium RIFCSPLOWO2_12_FULL_62_58]|nr:MAG: NnrS family protein [Betaproteobacteria bacterium RIFCSPLOWO2_12_FULL_62_58]
MNKLPPNRPAQPLAPPASTGFALWNLGFRPFYLLASLFSAFSVLLWAAQYSGYLPSAYLWGPVWHGHEMLFGYTTAVIAGFLLTAVRAWTNQPTPSGVPLMALAALWVCGRVLVLTPLDLMAAVVNAAFPVAVAVAIGMPLLRSRNVRNYFFVGLLVLMGVLVLAVHLALRERFELSPRLGLQLALDVVLFIMAVMGGRVIPMFTNNGIPGTHATRHALVEKLALGTVMLLFAADLLQWNPIVVAAIALASALMHGVRLYLWQPWRTLATPLVWILHAAYAWIVAHLALRGLSELGLLAGSFATHALTVGAIGGLTIGMMTRTARGHTGRPLEADGFELTSYLLVQVAALVRVFGGMASPELYPASIQLSALLWAAAFGLYAVRYWPVLTRPRLDGRPG